MNHAASVKRALDYMEQHLRDEIRVEDVARAAGFSTSHFHSLFSRATGRTVKEHLRHRRLSCAAIDLALSRRPILHIALEYRFDSQESFTRAFTRLYGITPGLFRKNRAGLGITPRMGVYNPAAIPSGRASLAGTRMEITPAPEDRARRMVLEGVPRVGFFAGGDQCPESIPFPSCLAAALRYLGEDYPWLPVQAHGRTWRLNGANVHVLGSSGMAFGLLWRQGWHMESLDLMSVADPLEIIRRAFAATGYTYGVVEKTGAEDDEARYRQHLMASIRSGRPVLAFGVVGPPECALITGYDEGGDVLVGWSFFQSHRGWAGDLAFEPSGYFRKRDWFRQARSLVLIGEKAEPPISNSREVLAWAVQVAETTAIFGRHAGFAAYQAWAGQLLDDASFPVADPLVLGQRYAVHFAVSNSLAECRAWASEFLRQIALDEPATRADLRVAADCYTAEHDLMWKIWDLAGGHTDPEAYLRFADPAIRRQTASLIRKAMEIDQRAVQAIQQALARG